MSNYKFNIGDRVKILKMDKWSCSGMEENIGKIGVIIGRDDEDGVVGYDIGLENGRTTWYYAEDSLKLELVNKGMINKDDILSILYDTKENGVINYGTICDLIRRVRELPCK